MDQHVVNYYKQYYRESSCERKIMKTQNLTKKFDEQIIFENINLNFEEGNIYSIFGKNGVGKTTLLNILNGNLSFDGGQVIGNDDAIFLESNEVPFEFMTADEFIIETFKFKNSDLNFSEKDELFFKLDFKPENKMIKEFSKGMKSKLYIIIALLSNARILLLDEPFTDIDLFSFKSIEDILKLKKQNMIIIFSTHVPKIAFELSDKIIYLDKMSAQCLENRFKSESELEDYILQEMKRGIKP
ncbi:MAG: ATP-binding cassette domain-containing protein [Streptococcus sp.]|nr:ATP-binding cassette domain-containing protein [Streptococcus sp.]